MNLTGAEKLNNLCSEHKNIWMGIVNLTPDSFSDGGKYIDNKCALSRIDSLVEAGAKILDFGGASSRPNAAYVNPEEELKRVYGAIVEARKRIPANVLISLDTYSPIVAHKLAQEGLIDIVNDIFSGLRIENVMGVMCSTAHVAAQYNLGYIIMHMQGTPKDMQVNPVYNSCIAEVTTFLQERIQYAEQCGVKTIAIDPGIGFGKSLENNLELLSQEGIDSLLNLKKAVLIGLSRKTFLGKLYPELVEPFSRDHVSKQFEIKCLEFGAKIIRSHILPSELNLNIE
ncbi:dihydropteroate synthase [Fluviispira multicolorata]|uniref:dihydropteroate synthase n=1 Tax=Fluviispira multicolorata TaxID=2654512 RepID=A0A833JCS9_9BACT|nr:dihydropteroate synthase [Fluviispira multicolorata]KAB8030732.1 dihydropteroate synthase [Fluviispira multicolorata]